MSTFIVNDGVYEGTITIPKQTHTITLPTAGKYVEHDMNIGLSVRSADGTIGGTATDGTATAVINNTNSVNVLTANQLSGKTAGQDYWQIKATVTTQDGGYKPKYTISNANKAGWIGATVEAASNATVPVSVTNPSGASVYIPKIVGTTTITGTLTKTPAIGREAFSVNGVIDAGTDGTVLTTAPSSGVYVAVQSAANTSTITATPSVTTAGYGDSTYHGIAGNTATVGAAQSLKTYIPIKTQTPTLTGGGLTNKDLIVGYTNVTASTSQNNSGVYISTAATAGRAALTYSSPVSGWVEAGTTTPPSGCAALPYETWGEASYYINGVTLVAPSSGTRTFSITVPNGLESPITFVFSVDAAGNTTITDGQ